MLLQELFPPLYTEVDKGHGRVEERSIRVADFSCISAVFPGAKQIFKIERNTWRGEKFSHESVYGITSHDRFSADPRKLLKLNRQHWVIENKSHHIRDVVFREDLSQIRSGKGPAAFATLRNTAVSLFKLAGAKCVATELRACSRKSDIAIRALGISNFSVSNICPSRQY